MKNKRTLVISGCALLLAGAAAVWAGSRFVTAGGERFAKSGGQIDLRGRQISVETYQELTQKAPDCEILWDVPFQGRTWSSDTEHLAATDLTQEDVERLALFPELKRLDADQCTDYEALAACQKRYPDLDVRYQVKLGQESYASDTRKLSLADVSGEELTQAVKLLPKLTHVELTGTLPEGDVLKQLWDAYPEIEFTWEWEFQGRQMNNRLRSLDLSGMTLSYAETDRVLSLLPELVSADLRGSSLTARELMDLSDKYTDIALSWDMTFGDYTFSTGAEEIDISGTVLDSVEQVEEILPYFPNLKKVVMCDCGIDDETMDALNKRYDDIRFVWSVKIKYVSVRTDATWFYPYKFNPNLYVNNADVYPLRYCTDMVCIDIGHMGEVTDCEWAAFMPNLKYLIIGETGISDLTPLSGLKNLVYLEMFTIPVTDYSPLLGCTALEDLNLGKTYAPAEPISKMTWLKNLWWCDCATLGNPCSDAKDILPEALPNTTLKLYPEHPTASGWRKLDNYFAMRDYMDMFYLT